ncbi:nuclear transport factor 2 family protein [Ottowia thiooxydans]|uniref:nuclear transport factor 2 family protein n=1 Tax=Ottowia thiooxydans TaxID=219182 RepID=UPI00040C4680|nr:nuclear transport factor 2 family protein [Ottowia thiooxydans]
MTLINSEALQALLDREAIRDCLYRYCRGIDRRDEEALRSAYWPDATDRHGPYQGSATGFIDWALGKLKASDSRIVHRISNPLIELQGDQALVESYFDAIQEELNAEGLPVEALLSGRYLDRFERRNGEWRIIARTVVYDRMRHVLTTQALTPEAFGPRQPVGGQHPLDPLYAFLGRDGSQK